MANNYTPSYNQYLTQTAGYALPSNVRSYSVFDPSSNSWKRMTNDGRSPMPVQGQTPVADALALARQTQGRDWSAQPAPVQAPAQTPLGGPRMASPASRGGTVVVPMGQGRNVSSRASQGQIPVLPEEGAVQAPSTLYQGMGKTQEGGTVYTPLAVAVDSRPGVRDMVAVTREGIAVPAVPFDTAADTVAANIGLPPTNNRVNVADAAFRGLPEGFIQPKPTQTTFKLLPRDTPASILDNIEVSSAPNDDYDTVYDEAKSNVWKTDPNSPEAKRINNIIAGIGYGASLGIPLGRAAGQLGKMGFRALANTRTGQQLANNYRIVSNAARARGREVANKLADYLYNPKYSGPKGFERYAQDQKIAEKVAEMSRKPTNFDTAETLFRTPGF